MAIKEMICRLSEQAVQNTQQGSALAIQRSAETLIHRIPAGVYCYPVTAERMEPACFISDGMLRIFECTRDLFYEKYGGCVRRLIYPADEQRLEQPLATDQNRPPQSYTCRVRTYPGHTRWLSINRQVQRDEDGQLRAYVVAIDSTAQYEQQESLRKEREHYRRCAQRDLLTGIYNKVTAENMVGEKLAEEGCGALYLMDIDNFKMINDTLGHACGDETLSRASERLRAALRRDDIVGRVGGDEFLFYLRGIQTPANAVKLGEKLLHALTKPPLELQGKFQLSVSIGGVLCGADVRSYHTAYLRADEALYAAKAKGKNCMVLWQSDKSVKPV